MEATILEYEGLENADLINDLTGTYSRCLEISRAYTDGRLKDEVDKNEVDLDALDSFLKVRAELVRSAEDSLQTLTLRAAEEVNFGRNPLVDKAVAILEEMAEIEARLTDYLHSHLEKMKSTIGQMKRSEPVFKRYSHLGGPMHPSRISRHE